MSQTIDNRVVQLNLDNEGFEQNVDQSLSSIEKLNKALKFEDAARNLSGLEKVSSKFSFSGIADSMDSTFGEITKKLSTFRLSLASALGNIGSKLFGDLVIDPIEQSIRGGITRSQNIADAKFQLEGLGIAWKTVKEDIDYAVDGTAYGLDVAAKAASQLSASGVEVGQNMKAALRGISGVAAMGATEYEAVTPIFTKAAGQGRVMADELNRISQFGLNAAAELAKFFNNIDEYNDEQVPVQVAKQIKELTGGLKVTEKDIREFASHSEINFDMFAYAMDNAFGEHAKDANKTFTGALSNMKAALNRIGEQFRAPIMDAAIPMFNALRNMINGIKAIMTDSGLFEIWTRILNAASKFFTGGIEKVTKFLTEDFKGAANISKGLYNILYSIVRVVSVIADVFSKAFGGKGNGGLANSVNSAAESFEKLTEHLIPSEQTLQKIAKVCSVVAQVIKIVATEVGEFISKHKETISLVAKITAGVVGLLGVLRILRTVFLNPLTLTITGIAAAITAIVAVFRSWGLIVDFVKSKLSSLMITITPVLAKIEAFGEAIGNKVGPELSKLGAKIRQFVFQFRGLTFEDVKNQVLKFKDAIVELINKVSKFPVISEFIDKLKNGLANLRDNIARIKDQFLKFFESATGGSRLMTRSITSDMTILQRIVTTVTNVFKTLGVVLGGAVLGAVALFNKAFESLKNLKIDKITDGFKKFIQNVKEFNLLDTASEKLHFLGDKIKEVFTLIIDKIKEFIEKIKEGDYSLDFFIEKIQRIIIKLSEFKDRIIEAFAGNDTTRAMGQGPLADAMDFLREKFEWLKTTLGKGMEYIRQEGLLTKGLMIAYVLAILKALISFSSATKKIGDSISGPGGVISTFSEMISNFGTVGKTISGVINYFGARGGLLDSFFGGLTNSLTEFANAQKKSGLEQFTDTLKALAIVIVAVAGSLKVLSTIDSNELIKISLTLGVLTVAIVIVLGIMSKINNTVKEGESSVNNFAITLVALAGAVAALALVVWGISKIDWGTAIPGMFMLAGAIGALILIVRAIDKVDTSGATLKGAIFILALAVMLRSITKSMGELVANAEAYANLSPDALYSMVGLIVAFGVLCAVASNVNLGNAVAAVIMLQVFKKFMEALKEFTEVDYSTILAYLYEARTDLVTALVLVTLIVSAARVYLRVMAVEMAKLALDIGKGIAIAGAGFLAFAAGVLLLVGAIKKLSKLKLEGDQIATVIAGLLLISGMFVGLLAAAKVFSGAEKGFLTVAGAFALLGLAAIQIAITAKILKNVEWVPLIKALVIMGVITALMAGLILAAKANNNNMGMKSLIAIVAGMALMIGELMLLSVLVSNPATFENIKKALLILVGIMAAYGYVLFGAGSIKTGKSWAPILMIIVSLGAIFGALYVLSQQISSWQDVGVLAALAGILVGAVGGLMLITKKFMEFAKESNAGQGKWVTKALAMLGVMIGAFVVVAGTLVAASHFADFKAVGVMAVTLGAAVVGLAYAGKLIVESTKKMKWGEFAKAAATLGLMVGALVILTGVFTLLNNASMTRGPGGNEIFSTLLPLVAVIEILALIVKQLSNIDTSGVLKGVLAITAMTGIFAALALIAGLLNQFGGEAIGMLAKTQIVMLVLAELTGILAILGTMSVLAGEALIAIPGLLAMTIIFGALSLIAGLLNQFGGEAGDMLKKTQVVMLVLVELVAITAVLGLLAPLELVAIVAVPGLLGVVAVLGVIALIASAISGLDLSTAQADMDLLTGILWKLVGITAVLGLLSVGAVGELAGAAAILMICAALVPLTTAIRNMEGLDFDKVGQGLQLISKGLGLVFAAGAVGAIAGLGLVVLAAGIAAVGVACRIAAVGVQAFAMALMMMTAAVAPVIIAVKNAAQGLYDSFKEKLDKLKELPTDVINAIKSKFEGAVGAFKTAGANMANGLLEPFRKILGWHSPPKFIVDFFTDCGVAVNQNANGLTDLFEGTGETWGSALGKALKSKVSNIDLAGIGKALGIDLGGEIFNGALPGINSITQLLNSLGFSMNDKASKMSELNAQWKAGKLTLGEYTAKMGEVEKEYGATANATTDLTDALGDLGDAFDTTGGKAGGAKSQVADFHDSLESTLTSQMNIFSKFEEKAAMSKEELLANMQSQITGMTNWANNMDKLATMGIDQGLYQKLAEMGPQGAEYVGAFTSMTAEEMAKANELWAQSLVLPGNVAASVSDNFKALGDGTIDGFIGEVAAREGEVTTQMNEVGQVAYDGMHDSPMRFGSPSQAMIEFGFWAMVGLAQGILQNMGHPRNAIETAASVCVSTARARLAPDVFKPIGAGIVQGLQQGIDEQKGSLMTTLEEIAQKAEETLKKVLEVNSPSKVMIPIGSAITEGLAVGVENGYSFLDGSLNTVADKAVESMKYTVANIAAQINDSFEDPVITPVLDLSKVQAGVRTLNSTFSANQALSAGSAFNNLQNGQLSGNGNIIFNQVNNSPKALSRIEIYRDTRNLFAQAKGALS